MPWRIAMAFLVWLTAVGLFSIRAGAETRLALIVTNAKYPVEVGALANPHKDGELIAAALRNVGFAQADIAIVRDADQAALRLAVAEFIERIEKAGPQAVSFFYYSGHGAADRTDRGENYLIPIGAKITLARQLPILGVSLTEITKSLERVPAKARFVVLDACRNVAFTRGLKDAHKGFVPERRLDGIIVAFATRPGEVAEDNNVYASALASILPIPGLEAEQVFKETQRKVADLSKGNQIPWTEDGLLTRFRFKEAAAALPLVPESKAQQPAALKAPPASPTSSRAPDSKRIADWRSTVQPATFKMQSTFPVGWSASLLEKLASLSGGKLKVEVLAPGAVVPLAGQLDGVSGGVLTFGFSSPSYWADKSLALHIFNGQVSVGLEVGPFVRWMRDRGEAELNRLYQDRLRLKVNTLACGISGPEGIWFKKPLSSPSDLKGLRVRTVGLPSLVMQKLGISTQLVGIGEIVTALERGAIDGAEFAQPLGDDELGLPRVAKHYYYPGWHAPATLLELDVNLDTWNASSEAQKGLITEACRQNLDSTANSYESSARDGLSRIKAKGVEVRAVPKEILDAVRAARDEVARDFSARDPDFKRVWESYRSFR